MQSRRKNGKGRSQPPAISTSFRMPLKLRFQASSASSAAGTLVNVRDLYDIVCLATAANAAARLFSAIRIRSIELWGAPLAGGDPGAGTGTASTVGLRDLTLSPLGGVNQVVSDTHLGADSPAHIRWIPRKGSMAADWLDNTSTSNLLVLYHTDAAILDISFDAVLGMQNGFQNANVSAAITSTARLIYVRALDSGSSAIWGPMGLTGVNTA